MTHAVERIARNPDYFTYLSRCKAKVDVVTGDARLTLASVRDGQFDLLILDAFTSDALPIHLVTLEAVRLYLDNQEDIIGSRKHFQKSLQEHPLPPFAVLQKYPVGNNPTYGSADGLNFTGYTFNAPIHSKQDTYTSKLDYKLTDNESLFWRGTLQMFVRILDHHDGSVNHRADGNGDAAQGHDRRVDAERVHGNKCDQHAHWQHNDRH